MIEEIRNRWRAANALRADYRVAHGEDDSPEYAALAAVADNWLKALLMARINEMQR